MPAALERFLGVCLHAGSRLHAKYRLDVKVIDRQAIHGAMNQFADLILGTDHQGLIVFDDDCIPPVDVIPRLIDHWERGALFVAAAGIMRNFPHTTTIGRWFPEGMTFVQREDGRFEPRGFEWLDDIDRLPATVEADFCGVPVALIDRRVFERIPPPYYGTSWEGGECTHDIYLSRKMQQAGIKVLVDTTLRCGHIAPAPVMDFETRAIMRQQYHALTKQGRR